MDVHTNWVYEDQRIVSLVRDAFRLLIVRLILAESHSYVRMYRERYRRKRLSMVNNQRKDKDNVLSGFIKHKAQLLYVRLG